MAQFILLTLFDFFDIRFFLIMKLCWFDSAACFER